MVKDFLLPDLSQLRFGFVRRFETMMMWSESKLRLEQKLKP
jgi:hypothetical protein